MKRCLTDAELQAVADGEGGAREQAHVASCERCRARAAERRALVENFRALVDGSETPPGGLDARIERAVGAHAQHPSRGATTLRSAPAPAPIWRGPIWISTTGLAAAAALAIFVILPALDSSTDLSAAEILGRSLKTMSATSGVEFLEYELAIEGIESAFFEGSDRGAFTIQQIIDHDHPGRYRLSKVAADGTVVGAFAEDPIARRRTGSLRVDGETYFFDFALEDRQTVSLPETQRALMETWVAVLQASADQNISVIADGSGRSYLIQIPRVGKTGGDVERPLWDLHHARVVIDADDFRVEEFQTSGTFLKQPYSVRFRLISREIRSGSEVSASIFEIPAAPGDVALKGTARGSPLWDTATAALRELARSRDR